MSARVNEETAYSWYCMDCNEGGGGSDDEDFIQQDADAHNAEHHGGA